MATLMHGYVLTTSGYLHVLQVINHPNPKQLYADLMHKASIDSRNRSDGNLEQKERLRILAQQISVDALARNFDIITYEKNNIGTNRGLKLKVKLSEGYLGEYRGPIVYLKFKGDSENEPFVPNEIYLSGDTGVLVYKNGGLTYVDAMELSVDSIIPAITMKPGVGNLVPKSLVKFKAKNFDGYTRVLEIIRKIENYNGPGARIRSTVGSVIAAPGIFIE